MSYTEIVFFGKNGKPKFEAEIKNSWRGAMAVWNIIEERYLPAFVPEWALGLGRGNQKHHRMSSPEMKDKMEIWDCWKREDISETDRIALMSTFDWAIVARKDIPALVKAFREFEGETSLPEQADAIEDVFKDKNVTAVAWNQTSVSENHWTQYEYNDKKEQPIPYNLKKNDDHYLIFEHINKLTNQKQGG